MPMFDKNSGPIPGPGTVVGANVKLTGTLKDTNDIVIHGTVEGDVISDKNVLVAETAKVKGPIKALTINISGEVNGEVTATERLELQPSGKLTGSLSTKDLTIKSGASFNGKCSMIVQDLNDKNKKGGPQPAPTKAEPELPKQTESIEFEME